MDVCDLVSLLSAWEQAAAEAARAWRPAGFPTRRKQLRRVSGQTGRGCHGALSSRVTAERPARLISLAAGWEEGRNAHRLAVQGETVFYFSIYLQVIFLLWLKVSCKRGKSPLLCALALLPPPPLLFA